MTILFDVQIKLNANLETVWGLLTTTEQRQYWQTGIRKAVLITGTEGYRGAKTELNLSQFDTTVLEHVHRSRPLDRIHTHFTLGDCNYQQIIHVNRLSDNSTRLTYRCKQILHPGWRDILNIRPAIPVCVQPEIFKSLALHLKKPPLAA